MKSKKSTEKKKLNRKSPRRKGNATLMRDKLRAQTMNGSLKAAISIVAFGRGAAGVLTAAKQLDMDVVGAVDNDLASLRTVGTNFPGVETVLERPNSEKDVEACLALIAKRKTRGSKVIVVAALPRIDSSPLDSHGKVNERLQNIARVVVGCGAAVAIFELDPTPQGCRYAPLSPAPYKLLSAGGYNIVIVNLNTKDFGVALDRVRTFVFASRKKLDREAILDQIHMHSQKPSTIRNAIGDLPLDPPPHTKCVVSSYDSGGFYNHYPPQHSAQQIEKFSQIASGKKKERYKRSSFDGTLTIPIGHREPPMHPIANRILTPREILRITGFPDSFIIAGNYGEQQSQSSSASSPPLFKAVLAAASVAAGSKVGTARTPKPRKPR